MRLLTTDDLLYFQRCDRRTYLDAFGDQSQRDPPSGFLLKLRSDSATYRHRILSSIPADAPVSEPDYPDGDWAAAVAATEALMAAGAPFIYRGVLCDRSNPHITLVGMPHLLRRQPGQSRFGAWCYYPIDIRLGKRPKLEYQIVGAFHAELLGQIQASPCPRAEIILRSHQTRAIDLQLRLPHMRDRLQRCITLLTTAQEPEVFVSRNRCSLCPWTQACYQTATATQHLSLLAGVTPTRYRALRSLGITRVETLAAAHPPDLAARSALSERDARDLVLQAQSLRDFRAIARPQSRASAYHPPHFPHADGEFYFDIEAEPEQELDYLLGVLQVNHRTGQEQFHAFLAADPADESHIWQQFLTLMETHPHAPIFHFCTYEVEAVQRLGRRYRTARSRMERLIARFVDIHAWTVNTVILPVEGYALKQIAAYTGFHWHDPTASGAQAVYWYDRWLRTGDRTWLEAIVTYNEDDCRATYQVKQWLEQFFATQTTDPSTLHPPLPIALP